MTNDAASCSKPECMRANPNGKRWKGGRTIDTKGYAWVWVGVDHPQANKNGYVAEHRYVMSQLIGRPLEAYESVHHINGVRSENYVGNLQLRSGRHGSGVVHECLDCGGHNIRSVSLA